MQKELTSQEQTILNLLVEGISPKDIAYKLKISYHTFDFHRKNIYNKLGVHSIQELLVKNNSSEQNTETVSSAEPESETEDTLSFNIKNNKRKFLIPFGLGILVGVVSMLFVWWISMKPHGVGWGVLLILYIYGLADGPVKKRTVKIITQRIA